MGNQAIANLRASTLSIALGMAAMGMAWAQEGASAQTQAPAPQPQSAAPVSPAPSPAPEPTATAYADPATGEPAPAPEARPAAEPAPQPDPVESELDELDEDGDGKVSASEHAEGAKAKFDAMDADHNYHLSAQEATRDGGNASIAQPRTVADPVAPADNNNNGEISNEENRVDAEKAFLARDANRDGSLSPEEIRGASAAPAVPPEDDD